MKKLLLGSTALVVGGAIAAPAMAAWISANVRSPVIVGPDSESEQWVSEVARLAAAPYAVLAKIRKGDHDVEVGMEHASRWREHTPVLVDDIISSAGTMIAAVLAGMVSALSQIFVDVSTSQVLVLLFVVLFLQFRPQGVIAVRSRALDG